MNHSPPCAQHLRQLGYTALVKANVVSTANTMGPAKMIQVTQGDRLNLQAYAITVSGTGGNSSVITGMASIVAGSFGIVNSGETQAMYNAFQNVVPGYSGSVVSGSQVPKAYLCYILFNSDYTVSQFGYQAMNDINGVNQWQFLNVDVTIPYNGFIYIYTANESTVSEAYFDDVKIVHHKNTYSLRVTEVNDYDPYGMVLEGTRYVDESRIANNYKYQGEFAEFDSWTGWSRFEVRGNYDSRIGRWHSTDPYNQFASLYVGMGNDHINRVDPDGGMIVSLGIKLLTAFGVGAVGGGIYSLATDASPRESMRNVFYGGLMAAGAYGLAMVNWSLVGNTIGNAFQPVGPFMRQMAPIAKIGGIGLAQASNAGGTFVNHSNFSSVNLTGTSSPVAWENVLRMPRREYVAPRDLPTWDIATNRRTRELDPRVATSALQFINAVERDLGIQLRITQGYRSIAEQNALYAQGRTTPGEIVTNARGGESYHNYGLAFDIAQIINGQPIWNLSLENWNRIGAVAQRFGLEWGGNWTTFVDRPHFQNTFGQTIRQLMQIHRIVITR